MEPVHGIIRLTDNDSSGGNQYLEFRLYNTKYAYLGEITYYGYARFSEVRFEPAPGSKPVVRFGHVDLSQIRSALLNPNISESCYVGL